MTGRILNDAHALINGERHTQYGKPDESFRRIAIMWGAYLDVKITAADVAFMMALLKLGRQANKYKLDNLIDAAGYIGLGADLADADNDENNR